MTWPARRRRRWPLVRVVYVSMAVGIAVGGVAADLGVFDAAGRMLAVIYVAVS